MAQLNGICFEPCPGNGPTDPDTVFGSKGLAIGDSANQAEVAATPVHVTMTVLIPLFEVHPGVDVLTEPIDGNGGGVAEAGLHVSVGVGLLVFFGAEVFSVELPAGGKTTVGDAVVGGAVAVGVPSARAPGTVAGAPLAEPEFGEAQAVLAASTRPSVIPMSAVLL